MTCPICEDVNSPVYHADGWVRRYKDGALYAQQCRQTINLAEVKLKGATPQYIHTLTWSDAEAIVWANRGDLANAVCEEARKLYYGNLDNLDRHLLHLYGVSSPTQMNEKQLVECFKRMRRAIYTRPVKQDQGEEVREAA